MNHAAALFLISAIALFAAMLGLVEVGRWIGNRLRQKSPDGIQGVGAIQGAIFGLMGLLLAFTFSGAAERFEKRRSLAIEETNAIGTAYLRIILLPERVQDGLKEKFRQYLDARLAYYRAIPDVEKMAGEAARFATLQQEIWNLAVPLAENEGNAATLTLVASSLNAMIDITTTRAEALRTHPPVAVYVMLAILLLICALIAGFELSAGKVSLLLFKIGFCAVLATTVYVIIDYEYPNAGFLRITAAEQMLVNLRATMK